MPEDTTAQPAILPAGKRTEVMVRKFDDAGRLETETLTITIERTPAADEQEPLGGYL